MRTVEGSSFGLPESFVLLERPVPVPDAGQVRIRIEATALGYVDGLIIRGRYQLLPPLPYVPGGEIAGTVDAVGAGVTSVREGDRVATWQLGGGLAEWVVVNASDVDFVAPGLPLSTAAAMLVDYQTAHYAMFEQGKLKAGDTVLVLGSSGGVASVSVQLAVQAGAHVIAAASTEDKRNAALGLGAHSTVDYSRSDWRNALKELAPGGVDVVLDPVGGDAFDPAFRSLAKGGRYLVVGFAAGSIPTLPVNIALVKNAALLGVDIQYFLATQPERARRVRSALSSLVARGTLKAPNVIRFKLEQAQEALTATMVRARSGKVVVAPGPSGVNDDARDTLTNSRAHTS